MSYFQLLQNFPRQTPASIVLSSVITGIHYKDISRCFPSTTAPHEIFHSFPGRWRGQASAQFPHRVTASRELHRWTLHSSTLQLEVWLLFCNSMQVHLSVLFPSSVISRPFSRPIAMSCFCGRCINLLANEPFPIYSSEGMGGAFNNDNKPEIKLEMRMVCWGCGVRRGRRRWPSPSHRNQSWVHRMTSCVKSHLQGQICTRRIISAKATSQRPENSTSTSRGGTCKQFSRSSAQHHPSIHLRQTELNLCIACHGMNVRYTVHSYSGSPKLASDRYLNYLSSSARVAILADEG